MRMVGKGAANNLAARIRNVQNEPGVCVDKQGKKIDNNFKKKGRGKKRIILGVGAFVLLIAGWLAKAVLVDGGTIQIGELLIGQQADHIKAMEIYGKVYNGYLGDYGTVTVGDVFYETLPEGEWDVFLTDKDQIIAQYTTLDKNNKIQFMISENENRFNVVHMVFKGETLQEASDCKIALDSLYGEYFKNHPELGQRENTSWDNVTTEGHFTAPVAAAKANPMKEEAFGNDIALLQTASGEEVAAFIKAAGIPAEMEGFFYGDDDIVIVLDDVGKVEAVSIMSEQYSWYGMKVGEMFPVEQAENVFEMYGYGLVLSYEGQYLYAANSENALSPDGTMRIKLYDNQKIMEIDYMATGAEEAWTSLAVEGLGERSDLVETTPDYIAGSSEQLGEADIIQRMYAANNGTTMEIGEYSGTGETYVNFFQNNEIVWAGIVNRYQTLNDGGLVLMFEGDNYLTGEMDYLDVEWSTKKMKDSPVVVHESDTISISGTYSFSYPLFGN